LIFRAPVILVITFFLLIFQQAVKADESNVEIQKQYDKATHDTTRIKILFEMGNLFINGPSDSLIYYYEKALRIVRNNLAHLNLQKDTTSDLYLAYRNFEIRVLIEFGIEYFFRSEYEKALENYFEALEIGERIGDIDLISECYSEIGIVYKNQGKFDLALEHYSFSLDYAKQTSDSSWIASCKVNIGNVYKEKGYLTIALNYYLDALKTLEDLDHERRISACYQSIGDIYRKQLDYFKALDYYSKSLQLAIRTLDKVRETACYMNIGYVYFHLDQYEVARDYYNKAWELYKQSGYSHELDDCFILIGDTYMAEEKYIQAVDFYDQALEISTVEQDLTRRAEILGKLGIIYKQKQEYQKAIAQTEQGLLIAEEVGALDLVMEGTENLSEIYERLGWDKKALAGYKNFARLKDSMFNAEKYRAITEMEVKYESAKKEQQLAMLEERNQVQMLKLSWRNRLYFSSLLMLGLIGILAYILFRNQRLKTRHRAIELEQKLMRSQMNPHFIFNSLIAIQSYIYKQEAVKAGDYLAKFADLIRITLENSREEFVPLDKELKMLNAYLELQILRFEDKFTFAIEVKSDIESSMLKIPPMMAQPFIENAIEHGIRHKDEKGYIVIVFEKSDGYIQCTVEDDGVGREKTMENAKKKTHQSMATSITRERLEILSRREKRKFEMNIVDLKKKNGQAAGTKVIFNTPLRIVDSI